MSYTGILGDLQKTAKQVVAIRKVSYVVKCPGHKNSAGELAEWCIKSHETGKILSSHKSEGAAKSHLQDMHAHSGSAKYASYNVMCRVSGGATGTREALLKSNGKVQVFPTEEAAQKEAARLMGSMGRNSTAHFQYWAVPADDFSFEGSAKPKTADDLGPNGMAPEEAAGLLGQIRAGDRVTILVPAGRGRHGQEWKESTGRAVMKGPHGWALNMGGQYGTPGVASDRNIVKVMRRKESNPVKESEDKEDSGLGSLVGPAVNFVMENPEILASGTDKNAAADIMHSDGELEEKKVETQRAPVLPGKLDHPESANVNAIREALDTQKEMEVGKPIEKAQAEHDSEGGAKPEATKTVEVPAGDAKIVININAAAKCSLCNSAPADPQNIKGYCGACAADEKKKTANPDPGGAGPDTSAGELNKGTEEMSDIGAGADVLTLTAAYVKTAAITISQGEDVQGRHTIVNMNGREYVLRGPDAESFRVEYNAIKKPEGEVNALVQKYLDKLQPYGSQKSKEMPPRGVNRPSAPGAPDIRTWLRNKEEEEAKAPVSASQKFPKKARHDAKTAAPKQMVRKVAAAAPAVTSVIRSDAQGVVDAEIQKTSGFNFFFPGQVLKEFYPDLQHEVVDYPNDDNHPMIEDIDIGHPQQRMGSLNNLVDAALDTPKVSYVSTSPAAGAGIGRDGKPQVLDGAPLRKEQDIRGPMFTEEFYQNFDGLPSAVLSIEHQASWPKTAAGTPDEIGAFSMFLNKVCGEIAATMISAFKCSGRPLMTKIPGEGEVNLAQTEQPSIVPSFAELPLAGSRTAFLLEKLNDSEVRDAVNQASAQASVWHEGKTHGFVYEVFVRAKSIDTDTAIMRYEFITGARESE